MNKCLASLSPCVRKNTRAVTVKGGASHAVGVSLYGYTGRDVLGHNKGEKGKSKHGGEKETLLSEAVLSPFGGNGKGGLQGGFVGAV